MQTYVPYLQIHINVYNKIKRTNCFLGEMPDLFKVKVNGTAHLPYWGTLNYHSKACLTGRCPIKYNVKFCAHCHAHYINRQCISSSLIVMRVNK